LAICHLCKSKWFQGVLSFERCWHIHDIFPKKKRKGKSYGCLNSYLLRIMKKKGFFYNQHCNLVFELQWPLATHHISTLWVLSNKLHELQELQPTIYMVQLNWNSIKTTHFQLLSNFITTIIIMSCWRYWFSYIH
jgi:hypothetical protein